MKKNNFIITLFIMCFSFLFSQEEKKIMEGENLKNIFFLDSDFENLLNMKDFQNFEIKSFDSSGNEIPLCINEDLEIFLDCKSKIKYAQIVNSVIYDLEMKEIGRCFLGKIGNKESNEFLDAFDFWKGNITIYDQTESFRLATFIHVIPEKDYFKVLNLDSTVTLKIFKKAYKKLLKTYNIDKYPNDEEIISKNQAINEAFMVISRKIDPDYDDKQNWLLNFFSKNRRSNWSNDEGYVPYIKRNREDLKPVTQEKKERYPYIQKIE